MQLSRRQVDWQSQTDGGVAINLLSENCYLIYQWIIKICIIFRIIVVPFRIQIMQNKFLLKPDSPYQKFVKSWKHDVYWHEFKRAETAALYDRYGNTGCGVFKGGVQT